MNGLSVSRCRSARAAWSRPLVTLEMTSPSLRAVRALTTSASLAAAAASRLASRSRRETALSTVWRSARMSSVSMVATSPDGSIRPSTWITSSSSKTRTTSQIASASRMAARNWLPSPSPSEAPRTMPAMSTNVTVAGRIRSDPKISAKSSRRASGTATTPTLGSIVAKGEFAASTLLWVNALKRVDLPTLGSPTMPIERAIADSRLVQRHRSQLFVHSYDRLRCFSPWFGSTGSANKERSHHATDEDPRIVDVDPRTHIRGRVGNPHGLEPLPHAHPRDAAPRDGHARAAARADDRLDSCRDDTADHDRLPPR